MLSELKSGNEEYSYIDFNMYLNDEQASALIEEMTTWLYLESSK